MTITTWPVKLVPQRCAANPRNAVAAGPPNRYGKKQLVRSDAGFWEVRYTGLVIKDADTARLYRSVLARLREGEDVNLPIFDPYLPPAPGGSSHQLSGGHALRATTLDIGAVGAPLLRGMYICIERWLYLVTAVSAVPDGGLVNGVYTVQIWPPLREAYGGGQAVHDRPLALACVLDEVQSGNLDFDLSGIAFPSLAFVEQQP